MSEGPGEASFADVLNGISGGTPKRRSERRGMFRRRREEPAQHAADSGWDRTEAPPPGRHDGGAGLGDPAAFGDQTQTPAWGLDRSVADPHGAGRSSLQPAVEDDDEDGSSFVRPYAWTGGRTRPAYDLAVETLISLGPQGRDPSRVRQYEHRAVADMCREPRSVAEVAALLRLPLGVARVLIGDMASQGTVVVHQTAGTADGAPDVALMERVLSGLRRL